MSRYAKLVCALVPLLLLTSCLLTPGKFTSSLDIRADRTFTFTYQGEVIATDFGKSLPELKDTDKKPSATGAAYSLPIAGRATATASPAPASDTDPKMLSIAEALSKEQGYRSVKYVGANKFLIDYAITSKLDRGFNFPYNIDAQAVFPFVVIEVRNDGKVRVQAPGFADSSDKSGGMGGMGGSDQQTKALDGTFTLTTNAEIISQNQEDGMTTTPQGKRIVWKITPITKIAPMAMLRFGAGQ